MNPIIHYSTVNLSLAVSCHGRQKKRHKSCEFGEDKLGMKIAHGGAIPIPTRDVCRKADILSAFGLTAQGVRWFHACDVLGGKLKTHTCTLCESR
ncbi:hypothetical protein KP612_10920 [Treponema denticola]|uniref:hypothetical protein n=1 Tax=Treponema denticola TaxID=158 RepID=UPI0012BB193D|nr:hypothetical protein [Treponema denticola]